MNDNRTSVDLLVAKMAILAAKNRPAYRELRRVMWQLVVENSGRPGYPGLFS